MIYNISLTVDTDNNLVEALIVKNGTNMRLNNAPTNFYKDCHAEMIALIRNNESKLSRLVELLVADHEAAFVVFCAENNIVVPEIPAEENGGGLINGGGE